METKSKRNSIKSGEKSVVCCGLFCGLGVLGFFENGVVFSENGAGISRLAYMISPPFSYQYMKNRQNHMQISFFISMDFE